MMLKRIFRCTYLLTLIAVLTVPISAALADAGPSTPTPPPTPTIPFFLPTPTFTNVPYPYPSAGQAAPGTEPEQYMTIDESGEVVVVDEQATLDAMVVQLESGEEQAQAAATEEAPEESSGRPWTFWLLVGLAVVVLVVGALVAYFVFVRK